MKIVTSKYINVLHKSEFGHTQKKTKREVKAKIIKKQHRVSKLRNLSEVIEK